MRIRAVISTGRIQKLTHAEIASNARAVLDSMPKRMRQYEKTYASGYIRALLDALWSEVEFCYRDASGVLYSTHKDTPHRKTEEFYSSGRGCELGNMEGAHVWKGTDKPFTAWSVVGAEFKTVSADEWASFCADYRTYATENEMAGESVMYCKDSATKRILARVTYHADGSKTYEIAPNQAAQCEKVDYAARVNANNQGE